MAQVKTLNIDGSNVADFIVEQGTSGNWAYRKWNSGIAECFGNHAVNFQCKNNIGNCWFTDWLGIYYPTGLFLESNTAMPIASCTDNWSWLVMVQSGTNNNVVFRGARSSDYSQAYDTTVSIHAFGRWK